MDVFENFAVILRIERIYILYWIYMNDERELGASELIDEGKEFGWVDNGFGANVGLFETSNESFN